MNTEQNESLWLPIEQAEKDGRWYLLKYPARQAGEVEWEAEARWHPANHEMGWWVQRSGSDYGSPTHFRLPVGEGNERKEENQKLRKALKELYQADTMLRLRICQRAPQIKLFSDWQKHTEALTQVETLLKP